MDKVTQGMSQAGRHPHEALTQEQLRQESLKHRIGCSLKGVAEKVTRFLRTGPQNAGPRR